MSFDCDDFVEKCRQKALEYEVLEPNPYIFYLTLFEDEEFQTHYQYVFKHSRRSGVLKAVNDILTNSDRNDIKSKKPKKTFKAFRTEKHRITAQDVILDHDYLEQIELYKSLCAAEKWQPTALGLCYHFVVRASDLDVPSIVAEIEEDLRSRAQDIHRSPENSVSKEITMHKKMNSGTKNKLRFNSKSYLEGLKKKSSELGFLNPTSHIFYAALFENEELREDLQKEANFKLEQIEFYQKILNDAVQDQAISPVQGFREQVIEITAQAVVLDEKYVNAIEEYPISLVHKNQESASDLLGFLLFRTYNLVYPQELSFIIRKLDGTPFANKGYFARTTLIEPPEKKLEKFEDIWGSDEFEETGKFNGLRSSGPF